MTLVHMVMALAAAVGMASGIALWRMTGRRCELLLAASFGVIGTCATVLAFQG